MCNNHDITVLLHTFMFCSCFIPLFFVGCCQHKNVTASCMPACDLTTGAYLTMALEAECASDIQGLLDCGIGTFSVINRGNLFRYIFLPIGQFNSAGCRCIYSLPLGARIYYDVAYSMYAFAI